ncbi:MAG: 16S rRNA (uracil(1498)-N(3))-methyltransferase [Chloroflexaceae bacterium]|nr:16S rRNA (uracil(1498)-N(3))-methyltransferase [Chloroflexaceae bacterium]
MISNTYRFFVPPATLTAAQATLTDADLVHQISRVLRLHTGDQLLLLDGQGHAAVATLTQISRTAVQVQLAERMAAGGEADTDITLYVGLMRAERFEWLLQKGTEIGVATFVPVLWQRTQASEQTGARKQERWQRIIREAAEQACRGVLPTLHAPQPIAQVYATLPPDVPTLLLWEGPQTAAPAAPTPAPPTPSLRSTLRQLAAPAPLAPRQIAVLSGSEGGITPEELTAGLRRGIIPVSLGTRILRAETAPLVAAAAILYEWEPEPMA